MRHKPKLKNHIKKYGFFKGLLEYWKNRRKYKLFEMAEKHHHHGVQKMMDIGEVYDVKETKKGVSYRVGKSYNESVEDANLEKHKHKTDTSIDVSQKEAAKMLNVDLVTAYKELKLGDYRVKKRKRAKKK